MNDLSFNMNNNFPALDGSTSQLNKISEYLKIIYYCNIEY